MAEHEEQTEKPGERHVREQNRTEELELPVIVLGLLFALGIVGSIALML